MEDKDKKRGVFESTMYVGNLKLYWLSGKVESPTLKSRCNVCKTSSLIPLRSSRISPIKKEKEKCKPLWAGL
ncbi:uncharacterized protein LAJ45_06715 [Morchella importuna]|uniref:uncharacterized protein n=1 Tax=Morchella importuna TaxID=1174673 RepID=UPI001E8CD143|nr:uncharacterized protein LAJ45_06715 [Morchella importuna]KAH8149176.1 hypothetical protein LAJ45_06715 [Morchella importuna]